MTRATTCLGLLLLLAPITSARALDDAPAAPEVVALWPGDAPGETGPIAEEKATRKGDGPITSLTNVSKPTLTILRPAREKNAGVAVIVCPGGGYNNLAWDHEGEQVGRWLNGLGVTAALLKYRVPRRPGGPSDRPPVQALMDAQRAISLIRGRADALGVDPKKVGILGFSAGGHLGAWASTNYDRPAYDPVDATDKVDRRPDFAVLVYPGGVLKKGTDQLSSEIRVDSLTPPMFLAHAGDDPVSPENSVRLYLALKEAGVPAELHIYTSGGHGFGLRPSTNPASTWPRRCEEWLRVAKILPPARKS